MRALVREVSDTFPQALAHTPVVLDLARARAEHQRYVAVLRALGVAVTELPSLPAHPDACFVEDTVVVVDGRALVTRPGHPSRRGEVDTVAAFLAPHLPVVRMGEGTLDGGDVLRVGSRLYVGRSGRTDAAGIAAIAQAFPELEVVAVDLAEGLHLKSSATALPDGTVVCARAGVDPAVFGGVAWVVPDDEAAAANVLAVGPAVVAPAGFPATRAHLARRFPVHEVDNAELRKADSALTCLSVFW
jgi:dimethylargininase